MARSLEKTLEFDTQKCQYSNLKVGDMDISGRTPPRRIPQHLCWGGVHFNQFQRFYIS